MSEAGGVGTGPGTITNDGCAVEVYAGLPPRSEVDVIQRLVQPGGSVLDLGAGTGRMADPLARSGLEVVAVDDSAEMLAHVQRAEPLLAGIETLRLDRRFDVVLLASHLVNTSDDRQRQRFLETAAHHLAPTGTVAIEWHPPEWFDGLTPGARTHGSVDAFEVELQVHEVRDGLVDATVSYRRGDDEWTQRFQARRLSHRDLDTTLRRAGLRWDAYLTEDHSWVGARPADD